VVVTGGSSGTEELVVEYLAEKGVKVAVLDVNPPKST
jgi:NAD(P)-dependent dehydrogenase (short-subunit alcohol dehydrogenase family)